MVPGCDDNKNKNANQSRIGTVMCLFITIENRLTTGLVPIWDLERGGVAEDSLDASESVQDFGDRDGNGTREGVLINNPLP